MNQLSEAEKYMQRCLDLAAMAEGKTYPNPMVGSVIVHNGQIIGEGYHCKAGEPHAEVNAIRSVKDAALLKDSTLYVNLEPCAHFGKTPPCSKLIIEKQIPRVVIGCIDSFSEVAGKGIEMMRAAGVDVTVGVLEKESLELNRRFFTYHTQQRPYIILKWAQTLDGFIDIDRTSDNYGQPTWITNEWARRAVHKQRSTEQAILVGTHTAKKDNPSLTLRDWTGHQPLRIVIDRQCQLNANYHLLDGQTPTLVLNEVKDLVQAGVEYIKMDFSNGLQEEISKLLYQRHLQSLIIEGGHTTIQHFVDKGFWDEAHIYVGEKWFHQGVEAPRLSGRLIAKEDFANSKLFIYRNNL